MENKPSLDELNRLRACIGKEISIDVLCWDVTWDYGDSTCNESNTNYSMLLKEVTDSHLKGAYTRNYSWGIPTREVKKGEMVVQKFECHASGELGGWIGPSSRKITQITCDSDKIYIR
jgi:hypothetical protein